MTAVSLTLPFGRVTDGLARTVSTLAARWQRARRIAETRRYLQQMDDHMLSDLGVSRAQAMFELSRELERPGRR